MFFRICFVRKLIIELLATKMKVWSYVKLLYGLVQIEPSHRSGMKTLNFKSQ